MIGQTIIRTTLRRRNAVSLRRVTTSVHTFPGLVASGSGRGFQSTLRRRNAVPVRRMAAAAEEPSTKLKEEGEEEKPIPRELGGGDDKDLYVGIGVMGAFGLAGLYFAGLGHLTPYFAEKAEKLKKRATMVLTKRGEPKK